MPKLRRSWIVMMVAVGLLAAASVASADDTTTDDPADDTRISFGYDAENHVFIVDTSTTDAEPDCTFPEGELGLGYVAVDDGPLEITADNLGEDCVLSGEVVGGPNGQINHGQFMKLFHQIVGKKGNGCLNRIIAQSDLGKGDQQIRTSDVDEAFAIGERGDVEFTTFTADCERGKNDEGEDHPSSKAKKGEDGSPGNSGNARGRNK